MRGGRGPPPPAPLDNAGPRGKSTSTQGRHKLHHTFLILRACCPEVLRRAGPGNIRAGCREMTRKRGCSSDTGAHTGPRSPNRTVLVLR